MRVLLRLDGKESMAIAVEEVMIEIYEDGSKKMIAYAEYHSSKPKVINSED